MGWITPLGVTKLRSTTTGVVVGLSNEIASPAPDDVVPPGKYQAAEVALWHGATDQPDGPCTNCVTATPPPARVTISETHEPDCGASSVGATTLCGGIA